MAHAIVAMFLLSRPFLLLPAFRMESVDLQFVVVLLLLAMTFPYLLSRFQTVIGYLMADPLLVFLLLLVCSSWIWSSSPSDTIFGLLAFAGSTLWGIYFAVRFTVKEQVQIIAIAFAIAIVLGFALSVILPGFGRMTIAGQSNLWVGIYEHKNALGRHMTLAGIAYWTLMLLSTRKLIYLILTAICALQLWMALSVTSLAVLTAVVFLIFYSYFASSCASLIVRILIVSSIAGAILVLGVLALFETDFNVLNIVSTVMTALGRQSGSITLEVRQVVWDFVWNEFLRRPILGYGFDAFWTGDEVFIFQGIYWVPQHAHNGFLEALLQLGLLGTVSTVVHTLLVIRRSLILGQHKMGAASIWPFAYMSMHLLFNTTYALFLGQNSLPWMLYVSVSVSTAVMMQTTAPGQRKSPIDSGAGRAWPRPLAPAVPGGTSRFDKSLFSLASGVMVCTFFGLGYLVFSNDVGLARPINRNTELSVAFADFDTATPSPTATMQPTKTPLPPMTPTPTNTLRPVEALMSTPTLVPTVTPTPSPSPTDTPVPTATQTPTPTVTPSPTMTPSPTVTPSPTITPSPTVTPSPTPSPTPTATATPVGETATVSFARVNMRRGPDVGYRVLEKIVGLDKLVYVIGRNDESSWLQLDYDGNIGWVSADTLSYRFDPDSLPIVAAPPTVVLIENARGVNLREGPSTTFDVVTKLETGTVLDLTGANELGGWYFVCCSEDDQAGWVAATAVTLDGVAATAPIVRP